MDAENAPISTNWSKENASRPLEIASNTVPTTNAWNALTPPPSNKEPACPKSQSNQSLTAKPRTSTAAASVNKASELTPKDSANPQSKDASCTT